MNKIKAVVEWSDVVWKVNEETTTSESGMLETTASRSTDLKERLYNELMKRFLEKNEGSSDSTLQIRKTRPSDFSSGILDKSSTIKIRTERFVQVHPEEERMETAVVKTFKDFDEVTLITKAKTENLIIFNVFTSNLEYDDQLTKKLISFEFDIIEMFPDEMFSFNFYTFNPEVNNELPIDVGEKLLYKA